MKPEMLGGEGTRKGSLSVNEDWKRESERVCGERKLRSNYVGVGGMTCSGDAEELCIGMWDFFLSLLGFRRTMT